MRIFLLSLSFFFIPFFTLGSIKFDFYGIEIKLREISSNSKNNFIDPTKNLSKYQSLENYIKKDISEGFCSEIKKYQNEYQIEEFALIELLKRISSHYSENKNIQRIFLRELILKFGFDAILYFDGKNIFTYVKYDSFFLSVPYKEVGEHIYYCDVTYDIKVLNSSLKRLSEFSSEANVVHVSKFHFKAPEKKKTVSEIFFYAKKQHKLTYIINENWIEYLSSLPNFQINVNYTDREASNPIFESFKIILDEANLNDTIEKLSFILAYCQSIKYIDDIKSFKYEKYMFPIETISKGYGDCDDKSILFAFLVNSYFKIPTYYLFYETKNHMNIGMDFNYKQNNLVIVENNNSRLLVCEPSEEGVKIGEQMNKFRDVLPKVIR